jgi:hypothetical protein
VEEATAINEETHRQFLHIFIHWGSTTLFDMHVKMPRTKEQISGHLHEMKLARYDGCADSGDAAYIGMETCSYKVAAMHKGGKLPMPSRTCNLTCCHRRRILSTTRGHPARYNDKTLVLFDEFLKGIQDGEVLQDLEFELHEYGPDGNVRTAKYLGAWVMVDNGYLRWSTTIPPYKAALQRDQLQWSEWLESMRKDVECTFGILKGRFRISNSSGMGFGSDVIRDSSADDMEIDGEDPPVGGPGVRIVRKFTQDYVRTRLVEHFDILFKKTYPVAKQDRACGTNYIHGRMNLRLLQVLHYT